LVGGRTVSLSGYKDPSINGDYRVEATYIHYQWPAEVQYRYPLIMVHGQSCTGSPWETTPDGREGWQTRFIRRGAGVYVPDLVSRGRAGWARPEIWDFDTVSFPKMEGSWVTFRMGPEGSYSTDPAQRRPFAGSQFPISSFDQFGLELVPAWGVETAARLLLQPAVQKVVEGVGPSILMTHSQSGPFGWHVGAARSDLVKAIVAIEPARERAGSPLTSAEIASLAKFPILILYGDFIEGSAQWTFNRLENRGIADQIIAAGGDVTFIDLPTMGIFGNTHFIMEDMNSNVIADLIPCWIVSKDLAVDEDNVCPSESRHKASHIGDTAAVYAGYATPLNDESALVVGK